MKLEAFVREKVRGNGQTVSRYLGSIRRFRGWLGTRPLNLEAVREYETWLAARFKANSRIPMAVAVNLFLEWNGIPSEGQGSYRMRTPAKEIPANPRMVKPEAYTAFLARVENPAERLIVRLLHDSFLRPSDLVSLRVSELADVEGMTAIRKTTRKAGVMSNSLLTAETAAELRAFIAERGITDYLFEQGPGRPRHRTWPNHVLTKHGFQGSPRDFRRTGATNWSDDITSLMAQGGWADPKTVLMHYRKDLTARHVKAFEASVGRASDRPEEEPSGYA
jgi:integrase